MRIEVVSRNFEPEFTKVNSFGQRKVVSLKQRIKNSSNAEGILYHWTPEHQSNSANHRDAEEN